MTQIRFALAQIDTCVGDLAGNAAKVLDYTRRAAGEHARVVVFPFLLVVVFWLKCFPAITTIRDPSGRSSP